MEKPVKEETKEEVASSEVKDTTVEDKSDQKEDKESKTAAQESKQSPAAMIGNILSKPRPSPSPRSGLRRTPEDTASTPSTASPRSSRTSGGK